MANYVLILQEGLLTSAQRAEAISRELYNVTRPLSIQDPHEATYKYAPVIYHPVTGDGALMVDPKHLIVVHEQATLEKLTALFPNLQKMYALLSRQWRGSCAASPLNQYYHLQPPSATRST